MKNELQKITDSLQVQANPNSSLSQIGGELEMALSGLKVAQISDEYLSGTLRYCMLLTGIREKNLPAGLEIQVLFDFIRENFGQHTPEEIKLAFKKAVAGTLSVDSNCYENFSCAYFGRIMAAYREWSKHEVKFIPSKPELPASQTEADWSLFWEDCLEAAREGRIEQKIVPAAVADWLFDKGYLELTPQEQEEIFDRAAIIYRAELSESTTQADRQTLAIMKGDWEKNETILANVTNRAKVMAVKQYALTQI